MIEEVKPGFFVRQGRNGSWSRAYPNKKDQSKPLFSKGLDNVRWDMLFAGWKKTLIILIVILVASYGYWHDTKVCREFQANPQKWCLQINMPGLKVFDEKGVIDENAAADISQGFNYSQQRE